MPRLHHVQVSCPAGGESIARAFYGQLLGLTEVDKPAPLAARGGVWFRAPGRRASHRSRGAFRAGQEGASGLLGRDVEAVAERLAAAGYDVNWNDDVPAYRRFHTHDGASNRVELLGELP